MNPVLLQKAAQLASQVTKNKKFIEALKYARDTKWASNNMLKAKPFASFVQDALNPRRLLRK